MVINFLLFDRFETLDTFGPMEMLSNMGRNPIRCFSLDGGAVLSSHGVPVITEPLTRLEPDGVLLLPGGMGTRTLVSDEVFLTALCAVAECSRYVLTVCTGSALLAASGLLDGRRATTNKHAFRWAASVSDRVQWVDHARWVRDGKYYTASGVSAGIDMALGFLCDRFGEDTAREMAVRAEYLWNDDPDFDPFAPPPQCPEYAD